MSAPMEIDFDELPFLSMPKSAPIPKKRISADSKCNSTTSLCVQRLIPPPQNVAKSSVSNVEPDIQSSNPPQIADDPQSDNEGKVVDNHVSRKSSPKNVFAASDSLEHAHNMLHWPRATLKWFATLVCIFITTSLITSFYYEVADELRMLAIEKQADIATCYNEYHENFCHKMRAPKLQQMCLDWERCMRQDPFQYSTLMVVTKVAAKCVEHFVQVLSAKTLFFIICVFLIFAYMKKTPTYVMNVQRDIPKIQ
jgi:hypothetical protein